MAARLSLCASDTPFTGHLILAPQRQITTNYYICLTDVVESFVDYGRSVSSVHLDEYLEHAVGGLTRLVCGEPLIEHTKTRVRLCRPVAYVVVAVAESTGQQTPIMFRLHVQQTSYLTRPPRSVTQRL